MVLFPEELTFEQKPKADRFVEIDSLLVWDSLEREGTKGIPQGPTGVSDRQETCSVFFLKLWVLGKCTCGGQRSKADIFFYCYPLNPQLPDQATSPWDLLLFLGPQHLSYRRVFITGYVDISSGYLGTGDLALSSCHKAGTWCSNCLSRLGNLVQQEKRASVYLRFCHWSGMVQIPSNATTHNFSKLLKNIYVCVLPSGMSVYMCVVPMETKRGCWIF